MICFKHSKQVIIRTGPYLIDLSPKAMLEDLLLRLEPLLVLDEVHVGEHSHHLRHAVHLADVDELEGLHLEAEGRVDEEEDL